MPFDCESVKEIEKKIKMSQKMSVILICILLPALTWVPNNFDCFYAGLHTHVIIKLQLLLSMMNKYNVVRYYHFDLSFLNVYSPTYFFSNKLSHHVLRKRQIFPDLVYESLGTCMTIIYWTIRSHLQTKWSLLETKLQTKMEQE